MIRLALAFVLCLTAPLGTAEAKSVQKEFVETWTARDARYQADYSSQVDTANASVDAFVKAANTDSSPDDVGTLFSVAMDRVHEASITLGRGKTVHELLELAERKPSAARGELWMQEQVDLLRQRQSNLNELQETMTNLGSSAGLSKIVEVTQKWVQAHGELQGRTEELSLLDLNLASYFKARGEEQAIRSANRRAVFAGIARALQDIPANTAMPMIGPVRTTCRTFGGVTNCRSQ